MMRHDFSNMVLWKELKEIAFLKDAFLYHIEKDCIEKIGQSLYINKNGIRDPLVSLEAEDNCHDLRGFYPLAVLAEELCLTNKEFIQTVNKHDCIKICGISMFVLPESLLSRSITDKKQIINIIEESDDEDGYSMVVRISTKFKLGTYSLE